MSEGAAVGIPRCADGSLYVEITRRTMDERLSEHAQGISKGYTASRRPVELLHSEHYERAEEAVAAEQGMIAGEESGLHMRGLRSPPRLRGAAGSGGAA